MSLRPRTRSQTPISHSPWGQAYGGQGLLSAAPIPRGGMAHWSRPMRASNPPTDNDVSPAQKAGIDPTKPIESYPTVPMGWIYTPLLGSESAGLAFFHLASQGRTLVQFSPNHVYNFQGGVFYPEPAQFDEIVCKDLDVNDGAATFTCKVAGKEGAETAVWFNICGVVQEGQPVQLLWYEIFNQRSRTSITIVPSDKRYDLSDYGQGYGMRGLPFSTGTAVVANRRMQEMELDTFVFSSWDQRQREKKKFIAHILWTKFKEDLQVRTMYTVEKMDQNHQAVAQAMSGSDLPDMHAFDKVNVNEIPM